MLRLNPTLSKAALYLVVAVLSLLGIVRHWNNQMMHPNCTVSYMSGAANLDSSLRWQISMADFEKFKNATLAEQNVFHFQRIPHDQTFAYQFPRSKGLIYITWFATKLFFWVSDLNALRLLNLLVHFALAFLLITSFKDARLRFLIWVFYVLNPIIINITTFPFYYFWQELPSVWLISRVYSNDRRAKILDGLSPFVFFLSVFTRPSVLFICLFYYGYLLFKRKYRIACSMLLLFVAFVAFSRSRTQNYFEPWHTAYIGIGAYGNPFGIDFRDGCGYERFTEKTGIVLGFEPDDNYCVDPVLRKSYYDTMKDEYLAIVQSHPLLILRNAIYNYFLAFSIGVTNLAAPALFTAMVIGLLVVAFLLYHKAYIWLLGASFSAAGFVPYAPSMPSYMFGNYVFSIVGVLYVLFQQSWFLNCLGNVQAYGYKILPFLSIMKKY